jgi:subtilase family serine protease
MSSPIITRVIEEMSDLPDDLQQQVLQFVTTLRQQHLQSSGNAWDVLESLAGAVKAPADWSAQHDHYLYGTPKHGRTKS